MTEKQLPKEFHWREHTLLHFRWSTGSILYNLWRKPKMGRREKCCASGVWCMVVTGEDKCLRGSSWSLMWFRLEFLKQALFNSNRFSNPPLASLRCMFWSFDGREKKHRSRSKRIIVLAWSCSSWASASLWIYVLGAFGAVSLRRDATDKSIDDTSLSSRQEDEVIVTSYWLHIEMAVYY